MHCFCVRSQPPHAAQGARASHARPAMARLARAIGWAGGPGAVLRPISVWNWTVGPRCLYIYIGNRAENW
uniref:Uncharacterized protein n=1 Tax=Arundo donax TaxID=35708 RepID=A0A0A8Y213_ARUDO